MKRVGLGFLFLLILGGLPWISWARTFEVRPQGRGEASLEGALEMAQPGDEVVLAPGRYLPRDRFGPSRNGEQDRPITIRAQKAHQSVIHGLGIEVGLYLRNKEYIVVQGLAFKSFFNGAAVYLVQSRHCRLIGLVVQGAKAQGISLVASSNNVISDCEVSGSLSSGLAIMPDKETGLPSRQNAVLGNTSHDNTRQGLLILSSDTTISDNTCYHNGSKSPYDHGIYSIGENNRITGNICHDHPFGSGIRLGGFNHLVRDNNCFQNGRSGLILSSTEATGRILVLDNRFSENRHAGIEIDTGEFSPDDIYLRGNLLENNLVNLWVKDGARQVQAVNNVLIAPEKFQVRHDGLPGPISFEKCLFWGPNCTFYQEPRGAMDGVVFFENFNQKVSCFPDPSTRDQDPNNIPVGPGTGSPVPWPEPKSFP